MKKLLRYGDCLILLAAIVGCGLRFWFGEAGLDPRGLYKVEHPAWILLCLVSLGVVAFVWFLTRDPGDNSRHGDNFPKSVVGAVAYWLLAAVLAYNGVFDFLGAGEWLERIVALASMLTAICLAVAGVERFSGNQPVFFVHMVPCVFFALRLFLLGRELGTDPEICGFFFRFMASLALVPAFYWLWAFDVDQGNRRNSLFFSLCAVYFCLVTTVEVLEGWAMYLLCGACLLANLCRQRYLPAVAEDAEVVEELPVEAAPGETGEAVAEPAEEVVEEVAAVPVQREKPVLHWDIDPDADLEAFLEDIKLYLDDQGY